MSLYKIRNFVIAAILIIAAFIMQNTIISRIPGLGCAPDIVLVIAFVYGYKNGRISGMLIGFFGGLITDVFFCDYIGYNALILLIIGFISGIWNTFFYSDDLYIPLLLLTGSDLLMCLINYVFQHLLQARFDFVYYLVHSILPEFLMTFIVGVILYKPLSALLERLKYIPED
jgi:rod shape-determining protein MreD